MTASTSRVTLRYKPEAAFGVIDTNASNPHFDLRMTGESFSYTINKEKSAEINGFRAVSSAIPVSAMAGGGFNGEMQYGEYERFLIAALQESTPLVYGVNGVGATFNATFTATTITAAVAPTTTSAFTGLQRGQFFQFIGADANSVNHLAVFRVSKTVAPTSTIITLDAGTPAVTGSVTGGKLSACRYRNDTTQRSFTFERASADITQFFAYLGQTLSTFNISISTGSLTTINFEFMGTGAQRAGATMLNGTNTASQNYDVQSAVSGRDCELWIGGAPLSNVFVKSISLDYSNALRERQAICSLPTVSIGNGEIDASVSASIYFANGDLFDQFLANTYVEVVFSSLDAANNGHIFTLPRCNIASYEVVAGSKDSDMMVEVTFMPLRDAGNAIADLRRLIFIDRVGVAVAV